MTIRMDRRVLIAAVALIVVALALGLGIFVGSGASQGQPSAAAVEPAASNPAAPQGSTITQPIAPVNPSDPAAAASVGVPIVRPDEAKQGVGKPNILFVDVRPADQYKQGHIPGALSLPYAEVAQRAGELPRDKSLVIYCDCRNDGEAANFASRLRPLGYADLWVLRGGWQGWKAASGPVE